MAYTLSQVTAVSSFLPAFALAFCVTYSIAYHAEQSLQTHCHTTNYLPSISAAAGEASPEKQLWSLFLSVSCLLRLLLAVGYYQEIRNRLRWDSNCCIVNIHFGFNCTELASLLGLSIISSSDNFPIHRNCFAVFLASSTIYMLLHVRVCCLLRQKPKFSEKILIAPASFTIKIFSLSIYCISIGFAMYFYWRHQVFCERLMYTFFAAAEYLVVYMNILFHFTAYFDLSHLTTGLVLNRWCDFIDDDASARPWKLPESYRARIEEA